MFGNKAVPAKIIISKHMKTGFLSLILHAHLPYVRHPEHESFFEENWLFEAITECYIPLINALDKLQKDHINYRLTLSLSPPLISMLGDDLLQTRYLKYLHKLIELAKKEVIRTKKQPEYQELAQYYLHLFQQTLDIYQNQYKGDLLTAFKKHHATGKLELITCAATHGFLPLLNISETAVRNQINTGIKTFKENLGVSPTGFWLPECAYYPGVETLLSEAGINYFFVDNHGITNASEAPKNGVYAPLDCGNGVAAFGRDPDTSKQVWSSHEGYPGDYDYREYYKDIGFDLDFDYIKPYILDNEIRINTGIKYYRVTGKNFPKNSTIQQKPWQKHSNTPKTLSTKGKCKLKHLTPAWIGLQSLSLPTMPNFLAIGGLKGHIGLRVFCAWQVNLTTMSKPLVVVII